MPRCRPSSRLGTPNGTIARLSCFCKPPRHPSRVHSRRDRYYSGVGRHVGPIYGDHDAYSIASRYMTSCGCLRRQPWALRLSQRRPAAVPHGRATGHEAAPWADPWDLAGWDLRAGRASGHGHGPDDNAWARSRPGSRRSPPSSTPATAPRSTLECVLAHILWYERRDKPRHQISTGDEGFYLQNPLTRELDSGLAASSVVYEEPPAYGGDLPEQERAEVWLDGGDVDLFSVEFGDSVPSDFSGDGVERLNSILLSRVVSTRPLPAGAYTGTHYNHSLDAVFVPCEGYTYPP